MTLQIGLTGGIGSGKTTVAKIFEVLGIPVYYADDAAKRLMNEDEELKSCIRDYFGDLAYAQGVLDRAFLASAVFNDPEKLERLNALVHPVTIKDGQEWMKKQTAPYAIKEAALIFESGLQQHLDYVIGVYAPLTLRLFRTLQRDKASKEAVAARMDKQLDEEMKMKLCDFVIINDEQKALLPQVTQLHEELLTLANKKKGADAKA